MKKRRIRRTHSADTSGATAEDRQAMQAYRTNRVSRRYYEDLDAINSGDGMKPQATDQPKQNKEKP